jgi:TrmH family RNA methyltransferase
MENTENQVPLTDFFKRIQKNLHFILVEPESPGNVGAVARAIKTSGFENLVLINPCNLQSAEAIKMAHRSYDIVEQAKIYNSFREAVANYSLVIATTMRRRHFKFPFYSPLEISDKISNIAVEQPVAIVFGNERNGLSNDQLLQCHIHSTIATASQNPALNLAQSVMIYANTFFVNLNETKRKYAYKLATQNEHEMFYKHLIRSLEAVNFVPRDGIENFITRMRRLLGRSLAEQRDIRLLHKLLQVFDTRISDLEKNITVDQKREIH